MRCLFTIIISMDHHQSDDEEACSFTLRSASGTVLPMVLKTAKELDLLELIKKAGSASACELAAQLPTEKNPDAATMIDRILRLLSAHSVLICRLVEKLPEEGGGGVERRYSLAPPVNEDGVSLPPAASWRIQDSVFVECWYHLKDAVLEGGTPFNMAHGMSLFEYLATNPRLSKTFNQTMSQYSTTIINKMLEIYKGFEGLNSLVDVGGGIGTILNMIISKYPSIKGINFDLPHVIQDAPSYSGVEHIGGDMFVSVPKADAIFLKSICHDWSDAHCHNLLKNCYESLPDYGKVIIVELILPDDPNDPALSRVAERDMVMLAYTPSGKERTLMEFQALAKQAGFKELRKVCCAFDTWIMELYK